ncbi:stage IV sporulation protein FA [Bacillus ectoiniformans]|uniref:peptidoglycan DD-metalloendopeptidase family protein n=1 Tax=Bacillus ectoiniformans TaxID=1494429 RepID=UPI00195E477D|nr:stage IV sporulation protein FA [Bacillus ectoiniformans]
MKEESKDHLLVKEDPEVLHPLFDGQKFFFKCLSAAALVLSMAIIFQQPAPIFKEGSEWFKRSMEKEFQFSKAAEWYESKLGQPLPFAVESWETKKEKELAEPEYALPASGRVTQDFSTNGKGIMVTTGPEPFVKAIKDGTVIFNGQKEGLGQTIIVQHADNSESWYGHLDSSSIKVYDQVTTGSILAKAKANEESEGEFYLAIKQGEQFVDPNQVIPFE